MSIVFDPTGSLNVSTDPGDLPEASDGRNIHSGSMTRCKNLRLNERGKAVTRDGSKKLNSTVTETPVYWIEEQSGSRFAFAGTQIYENESSIDTGLTSAQWSAIQYNAYNDTAENIFALNGTDRKRIESSTVYEWGLAAPTNAPTITAGQGTGLTGLYNVRYTYVRKVGGVTVAESNPSSPATSFLDLTNQSLAVSVTTPSDSQVTHIRLYRTQANGAIYYQDQDIPTSDYTHGVCFTWEDTDNYISGGAFKFTVNDATHTTQNTYSWEEDLSQESDDTGSVGSGLDWYGESEELYQLYVEAVLAFGDGNPLSYEEFIELYGS